MTKRSGPNSTPPLSGDHGKKRTRRKSSVEIINCRLGIRQILYRLPRSFRDIVAFPVDEILDPAPSDAGVQNLSNFKLWKTVHMEGSRGVHVAAREGIGNMGLQEDDVENRMDLH